MITDKERDFLQKLLIGEITKEDNPKRYSAMMKRIQKRIDAGMANLIWLVENRLDILKDEETEINNPALERYRRFRGFAYIIFKLDPSVELRTLSLPDALKQLSLIYPKYYFEIIRKIKT